MKLHGILPFARTLLTTFCEPGSFVIDATCGNGHDTLFLSQLVGEEGHVFAFDIQKTAIEATNARLIENNVRENVTLIHDSHDKMSNLLPPSVKGKVSGAIFNLGYLPGSDKAITTTGESTISAIEQLMELLKKSGIIILVIYHGHEEGKQEKEQVMEYVQNLDQTKAHVLQYEFINQKNNPPFIVAIEKRA